MVNAVVRQKPVMRLSDCIAPHFSRPHKLIRAENSEYSDWWFKGGRGGAKSSYIPTEIVLGIIADPEANAIAFRRLHNTLRRSVVKEFERAILRLGVESLFKVNYSPAQITYKPTGQVIIFSGLDDADKIKSIKTLHGYFKYSWFEEASEINGIETIRNVKQSIHRGGDIAYSFISFNPPKDKRHWINIEVEKKMPGRYVHHSTYEGVPKHWLGKPFIKDAKALRESDFKAYQHEYEGIPVGQSERLIFAHKVKVRDFEVKDNWDGPYLGADWGFANDPNTLMKLWIENNGVGLGRLYVEYAEYGYKTELDNLPRMWNRVPDIKPHKIFADCARPETVSHMKRRGFRCESASKWPGSIEDGIAILLGFCEIVVHTRCKEFQIECFAYAYKFDERTQEILTKILDKDNHGWDAIRYALSKFIKPNRASILTRRK